MEYKGFWRRDSLQSIVVSRRRLYDMLRPRIGKKNAKSLAYGKKNSRWKQDILSECLGGNMNLRDIRILYMFHCNLGPRQLVRLMDNKQKYVLKRD